MVRSFLNRLLNRWSDPIIVVSGLPRSGTSMAMKMLDAGGIVPFTDRVRVADEDNPKGYFEYEPVKQLHETRDKSWLRGARGKCVKVISYLLTQLPDDNRYLVVFLNRHPDEVIASQNKMLDRRGEQLEQDDEVMKKHFSKHLHQVKFWLRRQKNFRLLELDYPEVISSPMEASKKIQAFLGREMDLEKMVHAVDPRLYRNRQGEI